MTEYLVMAIESTADWRKRVVAEKFPDDVRNVQAARELDHLAESVSALSSNDPHFEEIETLWNVHGENLGMEFSELESQMLRDIGFRSLYSSGGEYLEGLTEGLREIVDRRMAD